MSCAAPCGTFSEITEKFSDWYSAYFDTHGYEFDGNNPKYSAVTSPEEFSYSSQSDSRSLSPSITDTNTDFENPDSDTDPYTDSEHSDSDPKSDHGDSVPPSEETDPG